MVLADRKVINVFAFTPTKIFVPFILSTPSPTLLLVPIHFRHAFVSTLHPPAILKAGTEKEGFPEKKVCAELWTK
jgi:hypothetical protein